MPNSNETREGTWRVNRSISVETIVITLLMLVSGLVFSLRIEGRVDMNENNIKVNERAISRVENAQAADMAEIRRLLERIDEKLNSKADKE